MAHLRRGRDALPIALGPDGALTVRIPNRLATRSFGPGEPVTLVWDPGETRLFAEASDGG